MVRVKSLMWLMTTPLLTAAVCWLIWEFMVI